MHTGTRLLALPYLLGAFMAGTLLALTLALAGQPACPSEDSCTVDYHGGAWHVMQAQP